MQHTFYSCQALDLAISLAAQPFSKIEMTASIPWSYLAGTSPNATT